MLWCQTASAHIPALYWLQDLVSSCRLGFSETSLKYQISHFDTQWDKQVIYFINTLFNNKPHKLSTDNNLSVFRNMTHSLNRTDIFIIFDFWDFLAFSTSLKIFSGYKEKT